MTPDFSAVDRSDVIRGGNRIGRESPFEFGRIEEGRPSRFDGWQAGAFVVNEIIHLLGLGGSEV